MKSPKTVLIFPGLDSLFSAFKLKRWVEIEEVEKSLFTASHHLSKLTEQNEDLGQFILNTSRPHVADFDRAMIALMAIQIGIARAVESVKQWDILLGCSHGDLARSVVAEVIPYANAVALVWSFSVFRKDMPEGYTANVRTVDGSKLSAAQIKWLEEEQQLPLSLWSEENGSVAGTRETLDLASARSREMGIKIKPVLPLPVHSPVMRTIAENLRYVLPLAELSEPRWPLFSSVWVRFLKGREEIADEAVAGAVSPVRWMASLQNLIQEHGVTELINVGPSNALTGWALNRNDVKIFDAWELIGVGENTHA
jgi:malonyl CoA-acyl carrier protein transacylase